MDTKPNEMIQKLTHGDLKNKLKDLIITWVGVFRERYGDSFNPEDWVEEYKDLIQRILIDPLKKCGRYMDAASDALCLIFKTDNPWGTWIIEESDIGQPRYIPYWRTLVDLAEGKKYEKIKDLCENHGKLTVGLGYLILYLLSATRIANEQVVYHSLLFRDREILQKYPKGKSYVDKALDYLSRGANYAYKMGIAQDYKVFCSYVWSVVRTIPQPSDEGFLRL